MMLMMLGGGGGVRLVGFLSSLCGPVCGAPRARARARRLDSLAGARAPTACSVHEISGRCPPLGVAP